MPIPIKSEVAGVLPLYDIVAIVLICFMMYCFLRMFRIFLSVTGRGRDRVEFVLKQTLPPFVFRIMKAEVQLIYFGLLSWRGLRADVGVEQHTYHRNSDDFVYLWVIFALSIFEIPVVHLVVKFWSETVAWIVTAIGSLGAIYVLGYAKSFYLCPIEVVGRVMRIRRGFDVDFTVDFSDIEDIVVLALSQQRHEQAWGLGIFDAPNVMVRAGTHNQ